MRKIQQKEIFGRILQKMAPLILSMPKTAGWDDRGYSIPGHRARFSMGRRRRDLRHRLGLVHAGTTRSRAPRNGSGRERWQLILNGAIGFERFSPARRRVVSSGRVTCLIRVHLNGGERDERVRSRQAPGPHQRPTRCAASCSSRAKHRRRRLRGGVDTFRPRSRAPPRCSQTAPRAPAATTKRTA